MTFETYCILFREKALLHNRDENYISSCLEYAKPLLEQNLPVIYDLKHFSQLVGYNENYIKRAVWYPRSFYYEYKVPKKNGIGTREISQPFPSLKEIQYWLLENILYNIPVSPYAKAYIRKKKLKENARFHKKREVVITYDITDFFHSIKKEKIQDLFLKLGYSELLSNLFSKLLTLRGGLPQGSPTSPCLSNIIMSDFDKNIGEYCKLNHLFYTRYADDLSFSSNMKVDPKALLTFIASETKKLKLTLNPQKTHVMESNQRQIVTGIIVNVKMQIPRELRKEIRKEVYYIKKFGFESHIKMIDCKNAKKYIKGLLGRINFALQVNPHDEELLSYRQVCSEFIIKNISQSDLK